MTEVIVSRLRMLPPGRMMALLSGVLILVAIAAAQLISEAMFRLLRDVHVAHIRLAVLVTAALVATPLISALVRTTIRIREERGQFTLQNQLLGTAQAYAKQGHWEFDVASGRFILSDALHHLLGDPGKKLQLTVPVLMEMAYPEDREKLAAAFERILVEGSREQIEYRIRGLNGQERTFWVTGTRQLGVDGKPVRAFGISQDITERKATEAALRESEEHYRYMTELSPFIPWVEDAEGNTLELSHRWFELTGLPVEGSLGKGWTETIHPDDLEPTEAAWQKALRTGEPHEVEHRVLVADGSYRWFRSLAAPRRNDKGEIVRWYGGVEDIHARKSAEIALRESEAFASSILEGSTDCIDVMDLNGRLQFMNGSCRRLMEAYGYSVHVGKDWTELWPDDLKPKVVEAFEAAKSGATAHFNCFGLTVDKKMGYWDVSVSPILGPTGEPERLLCMSRDITAQKDAQDALESARATAEIAAKQDSLTGLLNRHGFRTELEQQLGHTSVESQAAVLFLDLDEFKSVNDSLGHPAGDQLLREAGERLRSCLRGTDVIARFGGDEFATLQVGVKQPEQVETLAQRLIGCLSEPYLLEGREVVVGVSIGIAMADEPRVEADDLLKNADELWLKLGDGVWEGGVSWRVLKPARTSRRSDTP